MCNSVPLSVFRCLAERIRQSAIANGTKAQTQGPESEQQVSAPNVCERSESAGRAGGARKQVLELPLDI